MAGTGTDAAPYFRVFNPVLQGKKHNPDGAWVRRWVPEIGRVPDQFVQQPWKMALEAQRRAGCVIGRGYPLPIVDHTIARQRARRVRGGPWRRRQIASKSPRARASALNAIRGQASQGALAKLRMQRRLQANCSNTVSARYQPSAYPIFPFAEHPPWMTPRSPSNRIPITFP